MKYLFIQHSRVCPRTKTKSRRTVDTFWIGAKLRAPSSLRKNKYLLPHEDFKVEVEVETAEF
jgi:hypothetical protein